MKSTTDLILEHRKEKQESEDFKKRRFAQWNENYSLYRDKVELNRLTQRQPINVPIMRETVQTWISKIDEPPEMSFKSRGKSAKHKNGELILDELWMYYYDKLSLDILDQVDKKIVGLQGRSFKICGFAQGEFFIDIIDPYDIEISPRVNIFDLNSAQYVIRTHIYQPLRSILANGKYSAEAKMELKMYLDSKEGLVKSAETREAYNDKIERLRSLGAQNYDDYNASEVLVEINESYKLLWDNEKNQFVRYLIKIAADRTVLYCEPLTKAIGINYLPIVTWADDPDLNDPWCDGKGDSVRTINKLVNVYLSQDVENRTYRNFGMHFFDTKNGTFQPRAFDPKPFGMYGLPGNPNEILKSIEVPMLNDTMQQIGFLKDMIQSSVAQTATERGEQTKSRTTLGEVELNLEQSGQRNSVSSKHYRRAWKQTGVLFYDLLKKNMITPITLSKEGADGELYEKTIYPKDFVFPEGYEVRVSMKSESETRDQYMLQKTQYVLNAFQDNPVAQRLAKRKQLELMGWSEDEISQVMAAYEQQPAPVEDGSAVEEPEAQATGRPFNNQQVMQQMTA